MAARHILPMLQKHKFSPATLPDLHDQAPNTKSQPIRHGRLFELLRHDASVEANGEDHPMLTPRKEFKLSEDEMFEIQAAAMKTLRPRDF